jgi:HEAT repeat protein
MATLSRLENGDGVPALIDLSRGASDSWLSKQALQALARSGDPRARQFLRTAVARTDLADDIRATIARGIGGEFATGADAAALRDLYAKADGEKTRDAVMTSLAEMGGSENARWLMSIARDENETLRNRRRAIQLADRAGVPTADLVAMYDRVKDPQVRESLLAAYVQVGTKQATDKLLSIAKTETDYALRRKAVSYMSRSDDPRVKEALKEIVEKP